MILIDTNNDYGLGYGTLISISEHDRTKAHVIARNILEFLESHLNRLRLDYFFTGRGKIEGFPREIQEVTHNSNV